MSFGQKVHETAIILHNWLESSSFKSGSRLPSERSLTKELGLRHYAVNRAMARLIMEGTVERRGYKLYYTPNKERPVLGGFSCDLLISQRSIRLLTYQKVARELGIELRIHTWQSAEEAITTLIQLERNLPESLIFSLPFGIAASTWVPITVRLAQKEIPVICVGQEGDGISSITINSQRAVDLIFDRLIRVGHKELAFLSLSSWSPASIEVLNQWNSLCKTKGLISSCKRVLLRNNSRLYPEDTKRLAQRFSKEWKKVTALVVFTDNECPVQPLLDELADHGVEVPKRLSLVFIGDWQALHTSIPAISATAIDISMFHEAAFFLVQRALRRKKEMGFLPPPCDIRVQPHLIERHSIAANPFLTLAPKSTGPSSGNHTLTEPVHLWESGQDWQAAWRKPYDLVANAAESRFSQLNLRKKVNRPLNFRRGWLGDLPLKHIDPGRQLIHGIPFEILGGSQRTDCGAIVFQSRLNTIGNARKLPVRLRIPIGSLSTAIYILHGCGYSKYLNRFATYSFLDGKKRLGEVPLVSLGAPHPEIKAAELAKAISQANIQDWWPDYPHFNLPQAQMAPLFEGCNSDDIPRHVYLYTLEWINPSPKTTVSHMEIVVDPKQSTSLGILAVTVLGPRS